jgi:hypothetical protein
MLTAEIQTLFFFIHKPVSRLPQTLFKVEVMNPNPNPNPCFVHIHHCEEHARLCRHALMNQCRHHSLIARRWRQLP